MSFIISQTHFIFFYRAVTRAITSSLPTLVLLNQSKKCSVVAIRLMQKGKLRILALLRSK